MKNKTINYTVCVPTTKTQKAQFQAYFKRNGLVAGHWVLKKLQEAIDDGRIEPGTIVPLIDPQIEYAGRDGDKITCKVGIKGVTI